MEFFTFKINEIEVLDNRELGKAELKMLSFITGDDVNLPSLDQLLKTNDIQEKREIICTAAQTVLSSKVLMQMDNIKDGQKITFGDTGYSLYTASKMPIAFNWCLLLMEIDEDINVLGQKIDSITSSDGFDKVVENIMSLTGAVTNPGAVAGVEIAKYVVGVVTNTMIQNKDDQIGLIYQSFNKFEHYPEGKREKNDTPDLSNNLKIDYSIFGTTYE